MQLATCPTVLESARVSDPQKSWFAARLKELREAAGLTQSQLAELAGMHKLSVAKLEQGLREPSWATVQALAAALGIDCLAFQQKPAPRPPTGPGRPLKATREEEQPKRPRGRPRKGTEPVKPEGKKQEKGKGKEPRR